MPKVFQPFSAEIQVVEIPHYFREPIIDSYDGISDPHNYVSIFQTQMISRADDTLCCKKFARTSNGATHKWITVMLARFV